jgi:hypothetical protein
MLTRGIELEGFRCMRGNARGNAAMKDRPTALRVCLSLGVAAVVFVISFITAWRGVRGMPNWSYPHFSTMRLLVQVRDAVEAYRAKEGKLPQSLAQLKDIPEFYINESGEVIDDWRYPLQYEVHGETYLVTSYGRDGREGGAGLDADLTSEHPQWPGPTLSQFLWEMPTKGIINTCILSGVVAAVLTFLAVRVRPAGTQDIAGLAMRILVIAVATFVMGAFISVLHIPTGH